VALELTMSVYAVNYLCRELLRDHAFRAAMKRDPAGALDRFDLTGEERAALLAGDVATLYRMGVNAFLMGYLVRFERSAGSTFRPTTAASGPPRRADIDAEARRFQSCAAVTMI
jgi:hypothetical protein